MRTMRRINTDSSIILRTFPFIIPDSVPNFKSQELCRYVRRRPVFQHPTEMLVGRLACANAPFCSVVKNKISNGYGITEIPIEFTCLSALRSFHFLVSLKRSRQRDMLAV